MRIDEHPEPPPPPRGVPFAFFRWNSGWGHWEQVVPEAAGEDGVVAAYREPPQGPPSQSLDMSRIRLIPAHEKAA